MSRTTLAILGLLAVLVEGTAWAEETELVERAAVRHRLFEVKSRWELGVHAGLPLVTLLTDTYNFNLSAAYNPWEWLGVEVRGGYALSFNNTVARDVAVRVYEQTSALIDELPGTWRMEANGLVGVRFQPIYGKLSLLSELPVHFQLYLSVGGGGASLVRRSPMLCLHPKTSAADPGRCVTVESGSARVQWASFLGERRVAPVLSLAVGARLFLAQHHALSVEARSWSYADSYYLDVVREAVSPSSPTSGGRLASDPGFIHLGQLEIGYTVLF